MMKKEILVLTISTFIFACATKPQDVVDDDKVFMMCEEFTGGTVTSRWIVKNTLDYAVKYTYKLKASGPEESILVLGKQGELISNYAGYCHNSSKPIFVRYARY